MGNVMTPIQDDDIRKIIRKYVADSYLPSLILDEAQSRLVETYRHKEGVEADSHFRSLTMEAKSWVLASLSTGVYSNGAVKKPSAILDKVWNFISDIMFPGHHLKELKLEAKAYISTAEMEYAVFENSHEALLKMIQSQIDIINKQKPLMKGYILKKVSERLCAMGINSGVADYPMESLDTREFRLNDEFKEIRSEFKKLQENAYTQFLEDLPAGPVGFGPIVYVLVYKRIHQLENQIRNIKTLTGPVFEKMRSDIHKMDNLHKALKNIADIFTDITTRFIPALEKILDVIAVKYHNTLSEIPADVLCLLRTVTKILKNISEKCIVPKTDRDALIESTVSTSNNMSVEYERLREAMSDAA